jgi:multidrug efflux pump subunit AcrA (membrane-fusion protein)
MYDFRQRCSSAWLVWMALVLVSEVASAQMGPAKVSVAEVMESHDLSEWRSFVGSVQAPQHSSVGSAVAGRVVELLVRAGTPVTEGKPLAKLLTKNVEIQIAAAKAELELRRQELLELQNGARKEERLEAEARLKAAAAAQRLAQAKFARVQGLIERNAATREEIDEATSLSDTAAAMHNVAKAAHDLVMAGPRPEKLAQAQARADAAAEEVNRLEDILEKHTIKAPFDGYVVAEHTEVGQWIESGKLVAEVVKVNPIEVRVPVHESYISQLTRDAPARIHVEALPGHRFTGSVTAIVPKADEKSRTFPVRITLDNPAQTDGTPLLKPGMFAKVELPVDQKSQVLLVPKDSLVLGGQEPLVFVVTHEQGQKITVRQVAVQTGISLGSWIEVRGALKPKEQVVVEGNERLRAGAEVIPIPADIKRPAAPSPTTDAEKPRRPTPTVQRSN